MIVSFNHNVSHIVAQVSEKFCVHRIKEEPYIILFSARCPCCPRAALQPIGECVPEKPLLHLSNPFTHLCIINLLMPLQVGLSIGAMIAVI